MVAYSFAPQFVEAVASLKKRQTVRALRKRHALPGERLQLYSGMRTRYCRKLVKVDPICTDVRRVAIDIAPANPLIVLSIEIEGVPLSADEIEAFAVADGFGGALADGYARQRMGLFWIKNHPAAQFFEGVVIRWRPAD